MLDINIHAVPEDQTSKIEKASMFSKVWAAQRGNSNFTV